MDDDRIERALRAGPAQEPRYVPLGSTRRPIRRVRAWTRALQAVSALAVAVVVVAAIAVLRAGPAVPSDTVGANLLADLRTLGRIRIAVTERSPQIEVPSVGIEGFDVDVARAISERLGLRVEIDFADPAVVAAGDWGGRWDLALDSGVATSRRAQALDLGGGYYARAAVVMVAAESPVSELVELDGRAICVEPGSLADRWASGTLDLIGGAAARAPAAGRVMTDTAAGCVDAVRAGTADAFVADWRHEVGAVPADLRSLGAAPFVGVAAPSVDHARPGSATLIAEIDRIVAELRADGTLRTLSLRRFGGDDVSVLPEH